jgi:hypothetical protein
MARDSLVDTAWTASRPDFLVYVETGSSCVRATFRGRLIRGGAVRILSLPAILFAALTLVGASSANAQLYLPAYPLPTGGAAPWLEGWIGGGAQNNWQGGWAGFNYAFNHNVWSEGLLLRAEGGGGHYDYTQSTIFHGSPIDGGFVNVDYGTGALLLGWRHVVPGVGINTLITGYVGAEVQDHNNNDPTAAVHGTQWGVKFIGEIYSRLSQYQDFFGQGSFSSAFDTWQLIARPGFLLPTIVPGTDVFIGPDMQVFGIGQGWTRNANNCPNAGVFGGATSSGGLGSCKYDEGKIGGFLHIVIPNLPLYGDWLVAVGYRKPLLANGGGDGYYAQLNMSFRFQ